MRLKYTSIVQIENVCTVTREQVFNYHRKEYGPSSAGLKKERKSKEGCGRWGILAIVRDDREQ